MKAVCEPADIGTRRAKAEAVWQLTNELVIIFAGSPVSVPGALDQVYEYLVHPEYRWFTDRSEPGSILVLDPSEGWFEFVPEVSEVERLFNGTVQREGRTRSSFLPWFNKNIQRPIAILGAPDFPVKGSGELSSRLSRAIAPLRQSKDEIEIARIRQAVAATAAGFKAAKELIAPGVSERFLQIEIERAMFHAGAKRMGYESIVGAGSNSAVLHAMPGEKKLRLDDLVLIDMGGEIDGYCADVTRTFGVTESVPPPKRALYEIVLDAQKYAVNLCRPGTEWADVHRGAAVRLADGLRELGLVTVGAEDCVESGTVGLFFPHGVGHAFGMGVRDASSLHPTRVEPAVVGGTPLRCNLALETGFTMTVEPGLYFIPHLLNDPGKREKFKTSVRWDNVEPWIGIGGIRIEDNVLITEDEPDVLTRDIPNEFQVGGKG